MKLFTLLFALCASLSLSFAQEVYNIDLLANVDYTDGNGENGNDIWGYVDDAGIEYAIAGSTAATYIYSLEDPSNPILRARIAGATSTWRDIKDHNEYLYVVADVGTDGLLVINMAGAPDNITWEFYKPDVEVAGTVARLEKCHNLYITDEGYCILTGCNIFAGTPLFFDLSANAEEPPFVGASRRTYAHDVFAENNILYSSDIYLGQVTTHDYSDPSNIFELGSAFTSTTFTHNAWPTDDDASVFTTDERSGAFVDAFDVTDPTDIRFLDKFRPDDTYTSASIPHNTHVLGDYLATSWYEDGIVITDASRPHNMVEVGRYDTYEGEPPASSRRFVGNWGAYPFLPSGTLLASDIQLGLFVFAPNYQRGCYFEGTVIDSVTRQPIASVDINFADLPAQSTNSDISGEFATGIYEEGFYNVTFTREGYLPKSVVVNMERGELNEQEIELVSVDLSNIIVRVVDAAGADIASAESSVELVAAANGMVTVDAIGGAWGYVTNQVSGVTVDPGQTTTITIELQEGIYDDFLFNFGWQVVSTATTGQFERGVPNGTDDDGAPVQLGADLTFDFGGEAYVTGNQIGTFTEFDVDNGVTTLTSPTMDLRTMDNAAVEFYYYFFNAGGSGTPDDALIATIDNGTEQVQIFSVEETTLGGWQKFQSAPLSTLITLTESMTISFETSDLPGNGHIVEAMIDGFSVSSVSRPEVVFTPNSGCAPLGVEALATGAAGNTYSWEFAGADSPSATGDEPFVTYSEAGIYDVILTVTSAQGGVGTFVYSDVVEVLPQTQAAFRTEVMDQTVSFFNTSIGGQTTMWDFGDGTTSDEAFTQHVYATPGDYTVTLLVDGPCGEATTTQVVTITTVGTRDFTRETGIRVLGNPVTSQLTLANDNAEEISIELRNAIGQRVLTQVLGANATTQVGVNNLPAGSYFLACTDKANAAAAITIVR